MKEIGRSVFLSDIEGALKEYNTNTCRGKKKAAPGETAGSV